MSVCGGDRLESEQLPLTKITKFSLQDYTAWYHAELGAVGYTS